MVADFFDWFARGIETDPVAMYETFKQSFDRLFGAERSDAFWALTVNWGRLDESNLVKWLTRKEKAAARAVAKRRKNRQGNDEKKSAARDTAGRKKKRHR